MIPYKFTWLLSAILTTYPLSPLQYLQLSALRHNAYKCLCNSTDFLCSPRFPQLVYPYSPILCNSCYSTRFPYNSLQMLQLLVTLTISTTSPRISGDPLCFLTVSPSSICKFSHFLQFSLPNINNSVYTYIYLYSTIHTHLHIHSYTYTFTYIQLISQRFTIQFIFLQFIIYHSIRPCNC